MKEINFLIITLLLAFSINAQKSIKVEVFKSINIENGIREYKDENVFIFIDTISDIITLHDGWVSMQFKFSETKSHQQNGYNIKEGMVEELNTKNKLKFRYDININHTAIIIHFIDKNNSTVYYGTKNKDNNYLY